MKPKMRECPNCGEETRADEVICSFCNVDLRKFAVRAVREGPRP